MSAEDERWAELKLRGSEHYKSHGEMEPIDLIRAGGMLRAFALASIIKYAYRNSDASRPISKSDMAKIRHFAEMLEAIA